MDEGGRSPGGGGPTPEALSEMLARHKEKQQRLRERAAAQAGERPPTPPASSQGAPPLGWGSWLGSVPLPRPALALLLPPAAARSLPTGTRRAGLPCPPRCRSQD